MIEDIILKEFTGQDLNEAEKLKLEFWLNESPKNRKIYAQMKLASIYPESTQRESIKDDTWDDLKKQLSTEKRIPVEKSYLNWFRVAAVLFLSFSVLFMLYKTGQKRIADNQVSELKMVEKISLPGQKITSLLPDGTLVKLNAGSRMVISEFFTERMREVILEGEAYFEVARDESRPFIILANGIKIEVLGTSFNVKAYVSEGLREVEVAVRSGKVAVSGVSGESPVNLEQNEMTFLSKDGTLVKQPIKDKDLFFGWTDQRMVFKDHSIDEVLHTVSNWYGKEIQVSERIISDKPYTANYKNPVLAEVMESLSYVYNFKYTIDGKTITIN